MDAQELIKEILLDVSKDQAIIKADQAAMKADLREHIRRTNVLEHEVKTFRDKDLAWVKKQIWMFYGAISLILILYKILGK